MTLLQAMMMFPFAIVFILVVVFLFTYLLLSIINLFMYWQTKDSSKKIRPFWISVAVAFAATVLFIFKILTFEGPWIN